MKMQTRTHIVQEIYSFRRWETLQIRLLQNIILIV